MRWGSKALLGGFPEAEEDGAVVGDAAGVAGAEVGSEGFVTGVDVIVGGEEGRMEDFEGAAGGKCRADEHVVDELPMTFEADAALAPGGERCS